jgi:hypothetical protein
MSSKQFTSQVVVPGVPGEWCIITMDTWLLSFTLCL